MTELWQLYDEQAQPIPGKGAPRNEVLKGLLHSAAHVWIWRQSDKGIEILIQKRAANKKTWPNMLDISAAGHIDLGEEPLQAAVRETSEELGIEIDPSNLALLKVHRGKTTAPNGLIENEFKWLYTYETSDRLEFMLRTSEVASLRWVNLDNFSLDVFDATKYVPQGPGYFEALISFFEQVR